MSRRSPTQAGQHSWNQFGQRFGQRFGEWRGVWFITPTIAGLVLVLRFTGFLQVLEWAALDAFFRQRPVDRLDPTVVIVGIEEADIRAIGEWPASDAVIAELLKKIRQQQPRAIGLDLYRDLPVEPGYAELVEVFETTPNLIGIEKVIGNEDSPAILPSPVLSELGQVGTNDIVPDADGTIRRALLILPTEDESWVESMGLRLAQIYLEAEGITPDPEAMSLELGQATFIQFQANDGGYVQADDGGYQILLNFRGPAHSFPTVSMTDVLEGRVPPDLMRDRIVLVGTTAPSLKDFFYTPYSSNWINTPEQTAGVEIQASLASQIVNSALFGRPQIRVWAEPLEWGWVLLWSGIGATLGWTFRTFRWATISLLVAGSSLVGGCFLAFLSGWWLPVVPPALALVGSIAAITRYVAGLEREDRQTVMNLFGQHVDPAVAKAIWRDRHQILKQGRVQGQQLTATVLFTDIKDFSHIAEQTDPEALMVWLNEYMEAMAQLVFTYGGIVDKFIGDSVMAVFGVPIPRTTKEAIAKDAQQAVSCALEMAAKLQSLNQQWQAQGRPTAAMRIGISTGKVVIGSLGSSQRLNYTTIGDSVNVASRLESYDKSVHSSVCRILISEETYLLSRDQCSTEFHTEFVGKVMLRGRDQPIVTYLVLLDEENSAQAAPNADANIGLSSA